MMTVAQKIEALELELAECADQKMACSYHETWCMIDQRERNLRRRLEALKAIPVTLEDAQNELLRVQRDADNFHIQRDTALQNVDMLKEELSLAQQTLANRDAEVLELHQRIEGLKADHDIHLRELEDVANYHRKTLIERADEVEALQAKIKGLEADLDSFKETVYGGKIGE